MKVTESGIETCIETPRYHYFEFVGGVLFPRSFSLVGTFTGVSIIDSLRFEDWVGMMIHNKIIISSEVHLEENKDKELRSVSPLSDPYLFVEDTTQEYITRTLFTIINALIPAGSNLKTLECKQ